jgi:hypothetical protein
MTLSELLVYGLIVAGIVVFNYFMQQSAQKAQREEARRKAEQRAEAAPADDSGDYGWGRRPTPTVPARTEEAAPYEWGAGPGTVVVPPVEYLGVKRQPGEQALSLEELRAREARSRMEAERQRRAPRRKAETRRLFATRADLRRAVIAMTVLGPCRANEPPEPQDAGRTIARTQ